MSTVLSLKNCKHVVHTFPFKITDSIYVAFLYAWHYSSIHSLISFINQGVLVVKNLRASAGNTGDVGSNLGLGRSPKGGHGNPLQYSCLENLMGRGAWQATVHSITKSQTRLSD